MKKLSILATVGAALLLSSCNDFLDEPARGQQNRDNYFSTEEECQNYVNGLYYWITCDDWWQIYNPWLQVEMCTDNAWMGNTTQDGDYRNLVEYMPNGQENGPSSNFYQYRYKAILNCNIAIEALADEDIMMSSSTRANLMAQARFLRGYYYFELVKLYGGMVIMDHLYTAGEAEGVGRSTQDQTYEFIAEDFRYAIRNLPQKSELAAADMGRATRGAALGLHGKALVYRGKWKQAADTLGLIVREGEYDLCPSFGDNFDPTKKNGIESLMEVQHLYDAAYNIGCALSTVAGPRDVADQDGWAWGIPTAYLEKQFLDAGDTERLRWTIIKNGDTEIAGEPDFEALIEKQGNVNDNGSYFVNKGSQKSPRIFRKYYCPLAQRGEKFDQVHSPINWPILRYSDVLLLYAEALNELGRDAEAARFVTQVRQRAFLNGVNGKAGAELRNIIRKERQLELAGEFHRLFDIRRWIDDNGKPMIANIMGPNGSFVQFNTDKETADPDEFENQREPSNEGINFNENRDLLWPIPLVEIERSNGAIQQNPGW